jgi:hypothetical protein
MAFKADPDPNPAFHSNADPDPASKKKADPSVHFGFVCRRMSWRWSTERGEQPGQPPPQLLAPTASPFQPVSLLSIILSYLFLDPDAFAMKLVREKKLLFFFTVSDPYSFDTDTDPDPAF